VAVPPISRRARGISEAQFDALKLKAAELRAAGHDVINLGQAVPGWPPPPAAIAAAGAALADAETHVYSADAGLTELRTALATKLRGTHGADVGADEIIITAGGNQAFMLAAMTGIDEGDEVVLPSPLFINHQMAVEAIGAIPVEAPLSEENGFRPRWSDIAGSLTAKTRAVVLCSPSNPTGAVVDPGELERIARELSTRGVLLICDETYHRLIYDGASHASAAALPHWRDHVIVVGTFSKSFGMTGWRIGYMLAGQDVCDQAIKIQDAMIICAPVIAQRAVLGAIEQAWDYPQRFLPELERRRAALTEGIAAIPGWRWNRSMGGMFAFVRVDGCRDSAALAARALAQTHVVMIPGSMFGRSGEGHLRLAYGVATADQLTDACRRLAVLDRAV
jgi:aspartate/methionine/tyrosine aminotransferase